MQIAELQQFLYDIFAHINTAAVRSDYMDYQERDRMATMIIRNFYQLPARRSHEAIQALRDANGAFTPDDLLWRALEAGLYAGNKRLTDVQLVGLEIELTNACERLHQQAIVLANICHAADEFFHETFLPQEIQEEHIFFDALGSAAHAAHRAFCATLLQGPN